MAAVTISTVEDWWNLTNGVYGQGTSADYLEISLAADIDLMGQQWKGLSGGWYMYFHGNGHKIDNIYCMTPDSWSFVGSLHGYIENLSLTNIYVFSGNRVAGIADNFYSSHIRNVHISGYLEGRRGAYGFANLAQQSTTIENCSFSGALISYGGEASTWYRAANVSGLTLGVYNCQFTGSLVSFASTCSIFGGAEATVVNSEFRGHVSASGNIITAASGGKIVSCLVIIKQGSSWGGVSKSGGIYNSYYDITAAGETLDIGYESATTDNLQDTEWMSRAGMPCNSGNDNFKAYFEGESIRTSSGSMSIHGLNTVCATHLQIYVKSTLDYGSTSTSSVKITITNSTTGETLYTEDPKEVPIRPDFPFKIYDYSFPGSGLVFPADNTIKIAWTLKNCQTYWDNQTVGFANWWTGTGRKPASQSCIKSTLTLEIPSTRVIDDYNDGYPHYSMYSGNDFAGYSVDSSGYPNNYYIWKIDGKNDGYPWIVEGIPGLKELNILIKRQGVWENGNVCIFRNHLANFGKAVLFKT